VVKIVAFLLALPNRMVKGQTMMMALTRRLEKRRLEHRYKLWWVRLGREPEISTSSLVLCSYDLRVIRLLSMLYLSLYLI
jgi:hypothetical protein